MLSYAFGSSATKKNDVTKLSSSSWSDTSSDGSCEEPTISLSSRFPSLTKTDIARFQKHFVSADGNEDEMIQNLTEYVQFRTMYDLDSKENSKGGVDDEADWQWASKTAIEAAKQCKTALVPGLEASAFEDRVCKLKTLPQLCFAPQNEDGSPVLSKKGNPVIHYLPARLDLKQASSEIYALCIALYFERKAKSIDIDTTGGAVLLADARQGAGWPNRKVTTMVGFLKILSNTLHKIHPSRMTKLIIYPVPYACVYFFHMMRAFMPKGISENTTLINGGDGVRDPAPRKKLSKYVDLDAIDRMEETRLSHFKK